MAKLRFGITMSLENRDARQTDYECVRVVNSPLVTHYKYRLTSLRDR